MSMTKENQFLKNQAQNALSRGEWGKALVLLERCYTADPTDLRSRQKRAELLERLGRRSQAIGEFRKAAEAYAEGGFLLQAISVNKIMLRIDPSLTEINDTLADLYLKKDRGNKPDRTLPLIPLFSDLNKEELQWLLLHVRAKIFCSDEKICQEGDPSDSLMVISRGEVGIFKRVSNEEQRLIRILREGDFFGEFGFFTDQKRHATAKAASECEIFEIARNTILDMMPIYPHLRDVLSGFFEQRVLDLFFAASPLFSTLSSAERENIFRRFRPLEIPRDTLVFKGGDPPDSLYFIKRGAVEIFIQKRDGRKTLLADLEAGDFFGEIAPLFNKPRMASARTTQPSELLELSKVEVDYCIARFPSLRKILADISMRRLTQSNSEIFSQKNTEEMRKAML